MTSPLKKPNAKKRRRVAPLIMLFLLAPAIGELLSGSSPPVEFFNPFPLLTLTFLYGSGAVIVHELKVRWRKDYRAILLLGAAYGILEEGLMVKSFFDPSWMDLGILGTFGRYAGVNWVWAEMLIIYHMVFSITIPIVIVGLVYPDLKNERWTTNRSFMLFAAMLVGITIFGYLFLTPFVPPLPQYSIAIIAMSVIIYLAYKQPALKILVTNISRPRNAYLAGLAFGTSFFIIDFAGPYILGHPIIVMIIGFFLVYLIWLFVKHYDWESSRSAMSRWAIIAGALSFMITLAFLQELDKSRPDNTSFMGLVGLIAILLLLLLWKKVKKDMKVKESELLPPPFE